MAQAEIIIADDALLPEAVSLYNEVFRPSQDIAFFKRRLLGHYNPLVLIARVKTDEGVERPVGLWVGYEDRPGVFRHWISAVHPDFRRMGIARQLQDAEHSWAAEHGYASIRCEATNRQREFVKLNIDTGYEIIGLRYEGERADNVIVFEKSLETDDSD
jgi:GNAT superfamily N-acetyltransferase